ncbi:MAG: hypothetical protein JXQ96_10720 [Cyclobacteriaceae bacterium]
MSKITYVLAGPNGVGKSTKGEQFSKELSIDFINPDEISRIQKIKNGNTPLTNAQLNYVLDVSINAVLETDGVVFIENNLHDDSCFRFLLSYIHKHNTRSICRFYYLDDVQILIERVRERTKYLGHDVPEETIRERHQSSIMKIVEHINAFDEVHFFDTSELNEIKVLEVFDGQLNYVNEEADFEWSNNIRDQLIDTSLT